MTVKPISPQDMVPQEIPAEIIDTFNALIKANYQDGEAVIWEKAVVKQLVARGYRSSDLYDNHWLDVEPLYEQAGWRVVYDKPGYNETYEPSFTFTARKRK